MAQTKTIACDGCSVDVTRRVRDPDSFDPPAEPPAPGWALFRVQRRTTTGAVEVLSYDYCPTCAARALLALREAAREATQ